MGGGGRMDDYLAPVRRDGKGSAQARWFIGSTAAILLTAPIMLLWLVNGGAFLAELSG